MSAPLMEDLSCEVAAALGAAAPGAGPQVDGVSIDDRVLGAAARAMALGYAGQRVAAEAALDAARAVAAAGGGAVGPVAAASVHVAAAAITSTFGRDPEVSTARTHTRTS